MTSVANGLPSDLLTAMNPKPAGAAASAAGAADAHNRFMTLLVTQMKNQDPLNPLDNAQVTSQLAQLSTVSGIDRLNETMKTMLENSASAQALQAAQLIGHGVLVPGSRVALTGAQAIYGIALSGPADEVQLTISDGAGNPLRTLSLGAQAQGTHAMGWDGRLPGGGVAPDGTYQIAVRALRGGQPVTAEALSYAQVSSVSTGSGGATLNLAGRAAPAALADVRQIL